MKKVIYALILALVVVSGLVFANREIKNETSTTSFKWAFVPGWTINEFPAFANT